jgi:hypothetical protein
MLRDEVWREACGRERHLCVACVESRIGRALEPDEFSPVPLNDDDPCDSVRLRMAKGSGRRTAPLYALAGNAVIDLGVDLDTAATALGLDPSLLSTWVSNQRFNEEAIHAAA